MGKDKEKEPKGPKKRDAYDAVILHTQGQLNVSNVEADLDDGALVLITAEGGLHILGMENVIHAALTPLPEVP